GARFQLAVDKESAAMQVDIDLATVNAAPREECPCKEGSGGGLRRYVVNPKGYVVFHVSRGPGGYAVRVARVAGEHQGKPFDSRELQEGDLFAVTLIRPGAYSVSNLSNKARGEIVVAYPKAGKAPFSPPEAISIECTEKTLRPEKIRIEAAQGQVFRFKTPSRIRIELVKGDDGPGGPRPPKIAGWRKPGVGKPTPNDPKPKPGQRSSRREGS
ncbi:MAG: hypothetical protein Q8R28_23115, partial [Dehalococcoidia bacterium]|nr:hypothetical protein [Dehalococcoidia bacterium]